MPCAAAHKSDAMRFHTNQEKNMSASNPAKSGPVTPTGLNHLVLNVRNLEESHQFWTEIVGFKQVGELKATPAAPEPGQDALLQRRPRRTHEPS